LTENLTKNQRRLLFLCCQYALSQVPTIDIYNVCLLNHQFPSLNSSDPKIKICSPILKNHTLQKICYRDYCQQWLRDSTSINRQQVNFNHEIVLQKRRDKLYEQSENVQHQIIVDSQNSTEKFRGLLCQINSTWAFRLIDSQSYPDFGRNIGVINNSRAIIVLQSKVRFFSFINVSFKERKALPCMLRTHSVSYISSS
jgi:hypothetical protein